MKTPCPTRLLPPCPRLAAVITLAGLALLPALGRSQSLAPAESDSLDAPKPRRFAEVLRPTIKPAPRLRNQPYNPIRKADDQGDIPEIEMFVGESRVFPTPGVARIAVGNGQIMSAASLDNKEVIIFANAVGTSSLFVWNEDGRYQRVKINIVPGDTSRFAREIAAFLSGIPNAKASVIGDKVIVEGDNLRDYDISKIDELAKRYPQIVNFTNRLGWEQMVLMDVKVVEFPTNELREIGLKWGATGGAAVGAIWGPIRHGNSLSDYQINLQTGTSNPAPIGVPGGGDTLPVHSGINVMSVVNTGLNAQLALLAQNGKAAILAEPQLSARNGAKATFLAGGEYPYTVSTINGPTVLFKPYGIKLDIVPQVDRQGVIRATIDSEVSAIDTSLSTPAGPALTTRRTNTEFNVRNGETLVLSGLLSRKTSTNIDKVPFLGDIPVLGALFRSKRFQNDETELVVFVTPTVVDSHSRGLADRVEGATRRLEEDFGRPPFLNSPTQPEHDAAQPGQPSPAAEAGPPPRQDAAIEAATISDLPAAAPIQPAAALPAGANLLPAARPATPNLRLIKDGIVVRAAPSQTAPILVQLGGGTVVVPGPQGVQRGWRHVIVGSAEGWIPAEWSVATSQAPTLIRHESRSADRLEQNGRAAGTTGQLAESLGITANRAAGDGPAGRRYRVTLDRLALRVAPDVNAEILEHLAFDAPVESLSQPARQGWVAIRAGDRRGWAAARWLVPETMESP